MFPAALRLASPVALILAMSGAAMGAIAPQQGAATPTQAPAPDATSLLRDADAASQRGDLAAAIQLYQSVIIFAPADPGSYIALAQLHAANGQPELAEKYYGIALDLDPIYAPALKGLALLALAMGDRAGAEARHRVLLRACGQNCPETAQVGQALNQVNPN